MRLRDAKKHRSGFGGDIDAPQIARDYQIAAASAAIKAGGVTSSAELEERPGADLDLLAAQRHQPQDGRERTGDREIRSEVDADQDGADDRAGR